MHRSAGCRLQQQLRLVEFLQFVEFLQSIEFGRGIEPADLQRIEFRVWRGFQRGVERRFFRVVQRGAILVRRVDQRGPFVLIRTR